VQVFDLIRRVQRFYCVQRVQGRSMQHARDTVHVTCSSLSRHVLSVQL